MSTAPFDTHATVKRLLEAGMPEAQAEALGAALGQLGESQTAHLATKADLTTLGDRFDARLVQFDTRLEQFATKADLTALEIRLIK
jgi:hypothetical protein